MPSGASERMSSLFVLSELKVIEWSPTSHQVTEPPTGILITLGPNSSIWADARTARRPEPARTGFSPGRVRAGIGGFPCASSAAGCWSEGLLARELVDCRAANCAARAEDRLGRRDDRDLPGHVLAVEQAHEAVGAGGGRARQADGEALLRLQPAAVVVALGAVEDGLLVLGVGAEGGPGKSGRHVAGIGGGGGRVARALREEVGQRRVDREERGRRLRAVLLRGGQVVVGGDGRVGEAPERDRVRLADADVVEDDRVARVHGDRAREVAEEGLVRLRVEAVDVDLEGLGRRSPSPGRSSWRGSLRPAGAVKPTNSPIATATTSGSQPVKRFIRSPLQRCDGVEAATIIPDSGGDCKRQPTRCAGSRSRASAAGRARLAGSSPRARVGRPRSSRAVSGRAGCCRRSRAAACSAHRR